MALPTKSDLINLSFAYMGQPFVDVPGKTTITTWDLAYAYLGQPFGRNEAGGSGPPLRMKMGFGI